jgi:hypothetical protein
MALRQALLVSLVVLLSMRISTGQLNDLPPDCDQGVENIQKCIRGAVEAASATGCNWYRLIGPFDGCIRDAVAGCNYEEQEVWYQYVRSYNKTLTADGCYPACTNQEARAQGMFECFSGVDFEHLISDMHSAQDVQSSDPSCRLLYSMITCLLSSTNGCPALTDITHDRIYHAPNSVEVFSKCGIAPFQSATTNAPVALLDTNSMMPDLQTTTKFPGSLSEGETLLAILGSIFIIATLIVIIVVIIVTIRRSRAGHRRSILRDWRPNGQKVYIDEPQFHPAQNSNLYRPITISHNSGFVEDTVQAR